MPYYKYSDGRETLVTVTSPDGVNEENGYCTYVRRPIGTTRFFWFVEPFAIRPDISDIWHWKRISQEEYRSFRSECLRWKAERRESGMKAAIRLRDMKARRGMK